MRLKFIGNQNNALESMGLVVNRLLSFGLLLLVGIHGAYAQTPSNPYSYARSSSFSYDTTTGLLATETVESGNLQSCVVTSYVRDAYGNKQSSSTSNCTGATGTALFTARGSSGTFAAVASQTIVVEGSSVAVAVPAGQFSDSSTNALSQAQHSTFDPRFGATLSTTGPNGLTTTWGYDDFGRKTLEKRADGTSMITAYCYLSSSGLDTSSNSALCSSLTVASGEAPSDAVMFVHTEPRSNASVKNGPFARQYMDRAGHKIRMVTEAFDGTSQAGGTARLIVQDTDYNAYGAQIVATQPYFLDSGSSTGSGASDYGMSRTDYDSLGRATTNYVTDGKGSQSNIAFGSRGSRTASITTIAYAGLVTTTTNDLGQSKVEEKNADGQVVRVTDASGAQVAQQYDAFGNLVATKDALQNSVTLSYDIRGRKVSMTDPDTGVWTYGYDALGELVSQQSANQLAASQTTTMTYDVLGRMISRVEPEYTSTWSYDAYANGAACAMGIGKLCQTTTSNGLTRTYTYDSYGRSKDVRSDVTSGPSFASTTLYDNANGRVAGQVYPTGLQVTYGYTAKGYLQNVSNATALVVAPLPTTAGGSLRSAGTTLASGTALWTGVSMSAWGRFETQRNNVLSDGTSVGTATAFDGATGRVLSEHAGLGTATTAMNLAYGWDSLGRVTQRTDNNGAQFSGTSGAVTDSLAYDVVGRLQTDIVSAPGIPNLARTVNFEYNALGMLLYKSDVGVYSYPTQGSGVARPHAVQSVAGTYSASYTYDANGNATTAGAGAWRSVSYTSFNLPDGQTGIKGPSGSPQYTWLYDENHQRFKDVRVNSAGTRTTWMLHPDNVGGLSFEREEQSAGNSNRHYISVGSMAIGVLVTTGTLPTLSAATTAPVLTSVAAVKVEFWHLDRQGSLMATTDHAGAITAVYTYDPFGKRRQLTGVYDASGSLVVDWSPSVDSGTDRGYDGHEHLDDVGLIHMNGRLYDPTISRFMQGDPFIADPNQLQDYDRFAYCMNNPVTCTDPSGYWHIFGHNFLPGIFQNRAVVMVIAAVAAYYTGGLASTWLTGAGYGSIATVGGAAVGGFTMGAISTGNIKGAIQGALTAAVFAGVGDYVNNTGLFASNAVPGVAAAGQGSFTSIALHGIVGCVSSVAMGGRCGPGALSAAMSEAASGLSASANSAVGNNAPGLLISMAAGGTASVLGGGKFSNGAETAAYGYVFNTLAHAWAGTAATYAIADQLNARDGNTWIVNRGSFWDMVLNGRADLVASDGQTFEVKTNRCLSDASCELDAEKQLQSYVSSSNGQLSVGNEQTVFRGTSFILGFGATFETDLTFRFNPGVGGLIGYDVEDSENKMAEIWKNFYQKKSAPTTGVAPPLPPIIIPI